MMRFKRSYFNKAISVTMLIMLLLFHSVKLLHGHSAYFSNACESTGAEIINTDHIASADCGICSYQLGKDADDVIAAPGTALIPAPPVLNDHEPSFYTGTLFSFFESRGPPPSF
jgi:hypothetical protein